MCPDAGVSASGNATVTVAADNSSVTVAANYSGLSGPVTAGHIHFGNASAPGPVVLSLRPTAGLPVHEDADLRRLRPGGIDSARLPELRHRAEDR
jgi:hypothetical protein